MGMVFCRGCSKEIHETAPTCPHCGSTQNTRPTLVTSTGNEALSMSIISLILGIFCTLTLLDDSQWDGDTILGLAIFSLIGLFLGSLSIANHNSGKGMAVTGIILSSLSLLAAVGLAIN